MIHLPELCGQTSPPPPTTSSLGGRLGETVGGRSAPHDEACGALCTGGSRGGPQSVQIVQDLTASHLNRGSDISIEHKTVQV